MALSLVWDEAEPAGSDFANQLDTFMQRDKIAVRERQELEHFWNNSIVDPAIDTDGRHKAGFVGCLFQGTTVEIDAITTGGEGGIAFDTDTGELKRRDFVGGTWEAIPIGGVAVGPEVDLSLITPGGSASSSEDLSNAYDNNEATFSEEVTFDPDQELFWDLGSVHKGWFTILLDAKHNATGLGLGLLVGYDTDSGIEDRELKDTFYDAGPASGFVNKIIVTQPFIGQFIGIGREGGGAAGQVRFRIINVNASPFSF